MNTTDKNMLMTRHVVSYSVRRLAKRIRTRVHHTKLQDVDHQAHAVVGINPQTKRASNSLNSRLIEVHEHCEKDGQQDCGYEPFLTPA